MIATCVSVFLVGNIELLGTAQAAVSVAVRESVSHGLVGSGTEL